MQNTTKIGLSQKTIEAITDMELFPKWDSMMKCGLDDLVAAFETYDGKQATIALNQISFAAIHRKDRLAITKPMSLLFQDIINSTYALEEGASTIQVFSLTRSFRRALIEWWYDAILAHIGRDQIRSYIQSPFHYPPVEDRVRSTTANQITAYNDSAKKKLIEKLKEEQKETRDEAKKLREDGAGASEIERKELQIGAYDWAVDTIESSMSGG